MSAMSAFSDQGDIENQKSTVKISGILPDCGHFVNSRNKYLEHFSNIKFSYRNIRFVTYSTNLSLNVIKL